MKKLFVALALLSSIPIQAYDFPTFKADATKVAKVAGKLGWAAGMTCVGFGLLSAAVNFPENAFYAHNAFSKNQSYTWGGGPNPFIFHPDHSYTFKNYKVNSLAGPIIIGSVVTAACAYLAYRAFKSAYNSIKTIGQ